MNKDDVQKMIDDTHEEKANDAMFNVAKVPFHTHNNIDSPPIRITTLGGFPASFTGYAGYTLTVNSLATGLQFTPYQLTSIGQFPTSFSGAANKLLAVNAGATAVEFITNNSTITNQSVYATGTAYSLTQTTALLHFGTTDPSLTITTTGTYLLMARINIDYNSAAMATQRTLSFTLQRSSGTPASINNSSTSFITVGINANYTAGIIDLPPVFYAATANDVIQIWGKVDTLPTSGSIDITEASLIAIRVA